MKNIIHIALFLFLAGCTLPVLSQVEKETSLPFAAHSVELTPDAKKVIMNTLRAFDPNWTIEIELYKNSQGFTDFLFEKRKQAILAFLKSNKINIAKVVTLENEAADGYLDENAAIVQVQKVGILFRAAGMPTIPTPIANAEMQNKPKPEPAAELIYFNAELTHPLHPSLSKVKKTKTNMPIYH